MRLMVRDTFAAPAIFRTAVGTGTLHGFVGFARHRNISFSTGMIMIMRSDQVVKGTMGIETLDSYDLYSILCIPSL